MEHQAPTLVDARGFPIKTRSLLLEVEASNDSVLDFTGLDDTFPRYVIEGDNIAPDTDSVELKVRFSIAGDFKDGASDYSWAAREFRSDNNTGTSSDNTASAMVTTRTAANVRWGSSGNETGDIAFTVTRGSAGNYPRLWAETMQTNDLNNLMWTNAIGSYRGVDSGAIGDEGIDGIRLYFGVGLILQGIFRLYGVE